MHGRARLSTAKLTKSQPSATSAAGARTPRVCNFPPFEYSAGASAIRTAAEAGLHLDPWQQDVLTRALGVRDEDGLWSAFEVGVMVSRQNGKGSILEARVLAGLLLLGESLIVWTAHEMKTSLEAQRRVNHLFQTTPDLHRRVKRYNSQRGDEGIELHTGQRLRFIARSKNSGRGFTGDCIILDEAYELSDEEMDALMPTLSARENPQLWYTSSPPLNSISGAHLFRVRARGEQPNPDRLAWFDWGVEGRLDQLDEVDVADRRLWAASNPAYGIRIADWFIERELGALSKKGFARERLGIWPPDLSRNFQAIPAADWEDARDPLSRIDGTFALAVAVSLDRSQAAICAAGFRPDGLAHVEVTGNAHVVDSRPGTGWVVPRLIEIVKRRLPCALVIDAGGPAGSLIADVDNAIAAEKALVDRQGKPVLQVTRIGTSDVARGYGMFFDGISGEDRDGRIVRHLGQPELTAAVAGAVTRSMGPGATTWDAKNALVDITPLVAATNALYGLAVYGHADEGPIELEGRLFGEGS